MTENGYGPAPVAGHVGRIPNYGKTQVNPMGNYEPPACIQNAMMTKDKKPFTYTPGGLDLSQIRTPSMVRRMARQRSLEEQEPAYGQQPNNGGQYQGGYHPQGGPAPPPPPPPQAPAPPPPPPLVIEVPDSKSPKPVPIGERPEIVIPENPIGMLRKTNSPYHWEVEKADMQRMGPVPKFVEKVPSPLTVKMPSSNYSQPPPQNYSPQRQNYPYNQNNQNASSPVYKPEPQYPHQKSASPNVNTPPPTREILQRQDSQFNKSPQPFAGQSPISNGSPYSPSPNNNWRQPERRDSPAQNVSISPQSPKVNRSPFSPNSNTQQYSPSYPNNSPANSGPAYNTLPRVNNRNQDNETQNNYNNAVFNNTREVRPQSPKVDTSNPTPWRTNTINRNQRDPEPQHNIKHNQPAHQTQQAYTPPWKTNENTEPAYIPPWKQENKHTNQPQQQYQQPWASQDSNNNRVQSSTPWRSQDNTNIRIAPASPPQQNQEPRYQSTMSIPVTPRKQNPQPEQNNNNQPQKEVVFVNQEPVYFCPESPKSPPWVKEKTKTPPPAWVQKPLEGRRSAPRELATPPRDTNQEPEWVRKSNEMQRGVREVISPPKYQQPVQPTWSTRPSENRKSLPKDTTPGAPNVQGRVIPIQMEVTTDPRDQGRHGNQQPQLRIVIDMQNPNGRPNTQAPYSQPTQRIMRVLSPQLVRLDDDGQAQNDLLTLNRNFAGPDNQPKTRIIPIQIESDSGANKNFGGRY